MAVWFWDPTAIFTERPWAASTASERSTELSFRASDPRCGDLCGNRRAQLGIPRRGGFDGVVHGVDILHAFLRQPIFERLHAALGVHRDAFFPGGAAAQHAGEIRAGFGGHVQRLHELRIAYARAQIDKW